MGSTASEEVNEGRPLHVLLLPYHKKIHSQCMSEIKTLKLVKRYESIRNRGKPAKR